MTFPQWLVSRNLTTQDLAASLGLSYWTVAAWRQGRSKPDDQSAAKLRDKYPDCPLLEPETTA